MKETEPMRVCVHCKCSTKRLTCIACDRDTITIEEHKEYLKKLNGKACKGN